MTAHTPRHSPCVEVPNPEAAACLGKEAFDSPKLAYDVLAKRRTRETRVVYRCSFCRKYHLGRP